jgi:hypothetical protein
MTAPPVALFSPNPKWPGGYVQVLRDQGIEEGYIPHFLRWVRYVKILFELATDPHRQIQTFSPADMAGKK